jgi:hypothetical protein
MSFVVRVTLLNDEDEERIEYGEGQTVQDAVTHAEDEARRITRDDSFVMSEWEAA